MQPEGNVQNEAASATNVASMTTPEVLKKDNMFENAPKKSNGMLIGLVLCLILAIGGIGFGVWAMMDGNTKRENYDKQIADLKKQNSELLGKIEEIDTGDISGKTSTDSTYKNPIIKSNNDEIFYSVGFESSYILGQGGTKRVGLSIIDGKISNCTMYEQEGSGWRVTGQCSINGLNGDIFKIIEFGEGQDNGGDMIGFIMEDGKVAYFKLYDLGVTDSVDIKGYLNVDKQITDAFTIGVGNGVAGGYGSTVFVLGDGTFVKREEPIA